MTATGARGVIVHDAADVARALNVSKSTDEPVHLVSAPRAVLSLGPDVFFAMTHPAIDRRPADAPEATAILDCGDDAGQALRALRLGGRAIFFDGTSDVAAKLTDIAQQCGAEVVRKLPPTLDMADLALSDAPLADWLRQPLNGAP